MENNKEKKFWKVFVGFEDFQLDIADIRRIEQKIVTDMESPLDTPIAYVIKFHFYSSPFEREFKFYDEEVREEKFKDLQTRLKNKGVKFI